MSNAFDTMMQAMREARDADLACNQYARQMASLIRGRLQHCDGSDLAAIKRELRDFNIHTGKWKE